MASLGAMFADYAFHHQTRGNKWCHRIGIPLIMFSLIGMLGRIPLLGLEWLLVDAALLLIGVVTVVYLRLDWRFGAIMLAASIAMWALGRMVPLPLHVAMFAAGWVLQFVGHGVYEKRKPAFFTNLMHLLVGPLWIVNDAVHLIDETAPQPAGEAR
ncbi:MAG TPA: Mpo1-like protein [Thermoanaerobaculia bacterium]|nr:Mpo1-like protein [Thermoanaerobaculia bacterium]